MGILCGAYLRVHGTTVPDGTVVKQVKCRCLLTYAVILIHPEQKTTRVGCPTGKRCLRTGPDGSRCAGAIIEHGNARILKIGFSGSVGLSDPSGNGVRSTRTERPEPKIGKSTILVVLLPTPEPDDRSGPAP